MAGFHDRDSGGYGYDGGGHEPGAPHGVADPVSRWVQYAGAATSVALILGVVVWGYRLAVRDVSGVPVIRALEGPGRIAPEDPGGDLARHVGLSVNEVAGTGLAAPAPERVVLAPDPERLSDDDGPMSALRPLPDVPRPARAAAPEEPVPAVPPVAELPEGSAVALDAEAVPDPAAEAAEADVVVAGAAPPAAIPPAAKPVAAASAVIPTTVPGVARSPRPMKRPAKDLVANAIVADASGNRPTAKPKPVTEVDPAKLAEGTRVVQIGAFDSPEIARKEWDRIAARFDPLLDGKQRIVQKATSGGRDFWRLRVAGFGNVDEARRFCAALVAEGANCIPTLAR
ncbi:SPOR domain-containing protein [Sinirhodobacter ferrireducens]|uniref:SPOR domain-containing protein n=1 Tax=Paenirhodobacter ferrireducens TaxID=1215032 RepID=A0A443LUY2_9RHOB|nr:SPOR domain-containing protein [Sinirhodobacter ferrireducens]RWR52982.1 SPOR domain-containing protein [Sinirhodobacter ferrireducens]